MADIASDIEGVVRRFGEPTFRLKFIGGVLYQLYILRENGSPDYKHWLKVESE